MSGEGARPEPQTWAWGDPEPEPTPGWEFETQWTVAGGEYTRVYIRPVIQHTEPVAPAPARSYDGYHVHLPVYDNENDTCVGYVEQPADSRLVVITEPSFADQGARGVGDAFQQSGDDTIWMS